MLIIMHLVSYIYIYQQILVRYQIKKMQIIQFFRQYFRVTIIRNYSRILEPLGFLYLRISFVTRFITDRQRQGILMKLQDLHLSWCLQICQEYHFNLYFIPIFIQVQLDLYALINLFFHFLSVFKLTLNFIFQVTSFIH